MKCAGCQCWVHRVCGLINAVGATGTADIFCPPCLADSLRNGSRFRVRVPCRLFTNLGSLNVIEQRSAPEQQPGPAVYLQC